MAKAVGKPITCYTQQGEFIKTYPSTAEAARDLGVSRNAIWTAAQSKTRLCCGMRWRFFTCAQLTESEMPDMVAKAARPVSQYTLDGMLVTTYASVEEASEKTGNKVTYLRNAMRKDNQRHICGGYVWSYDRYERLPPELVPPDNRSRKVAQYDMEGTYIATFPSIRAAAQTVGVTPAALLRAARGETRFSGGYLWRFLDEVSLVVKNPKETKGSGKQ